MPARSRRIAQCGSRMAAEVGHVRCHCCSAWPCACAAHSGLKRQSVGHNRHGDLCRRLLLVRGSRFRQGARRDQHDLGLYRRPRRQSDLRAGLRGGTGHAEAVEIVYRPAKVSYEKLLDVFWRHVDPPAKDRQFCDHGDQYRTAIFYHDDEQRRSRRHPKKRRGALQAADPDRDRRRRALLQGGGLSPGLLSRRIRSVTSSTASTAAAIKGSSNCGVRAREKLKMINRRLLLSAQRFQRLRLRLSLARQEP